MDATWYARPSGPTRRLRGDVTYALFIYIWVIVHISLPIIGNTLTHVFDVSYKPDAFLLFCPCGTKFPRVLNAQDTWLKAWIAWTHGPPDQMEHPSACVDRMDARSTGSHQKHVV